MDIPNASHVVSPEGKPAVLVDTNGRCIVNTMTALAEGVGSGKPMDPKVLDKARAQAVWLLQDVVAAYETSVAEGEVGATGSGKASGAAPMAGQCPTGLLYGRIQSGKTLGMITFSALAIDNGFRVIVVLTSDNVKLVEQTASRFAALDSIVKDSTRVSTWAADAKHVRKSLGDVGLVLVCAKNQSHLAKLVEFLESVGAADYPAIILDDEADQATLDTTLAARTSGRANPPKYNSTINRRTVANTREDEVGESVLETLRHCVFIQVTATPYALLLQNIESALRPKFTRLLHPGDGYTGGERFFSGKHLDDMHPPLVFVHEDESAELSRGADAAPDGLARALAFFLVSCGSQAIVNPSMAGRTQNFLCHTSQKRDDHGHLASLIRQYLDEVTDELRKPEVGGRIRLHLEQAHADISKTLPQAPPLDAIFADLRRRLPKREVIVVNSDGGNAEFSRGVNFIVGGNILGRGLTIENLLVTYYLRSAKVSQMDTMLQHARMFGYREALLPYTRVYLPERLALRFHRIHTAEQNLRELLADPHRFANIPVEVGGELRATRTGVLDTGSILAYTPGQHVYPTAPLITRDAKAKHDSAKERVLSLGINFLDEKNGPHEPHPISLDEMASLIAIAPFDPADEDSWVPKALAGLLASSRARFSGEGWLYCRQMKRTRFRQGALSGAELKRLRSLGRPVLCLFWDTGRKYEIRNDRLYEHEFIYPSLVIPEGEKVPAHIFNVSE